MFKCARNVTVRMLLGVTIVLFFCWPNVFAGERNFTYVREVTTQPKGALEYEQYVTWKTDKDKDPTIDRFDFRHELEYGLTDRLQLGFYLSDWRYESGRTIKDDGAEWRNVALDVIYNLTDPVADPLGTALYGEVKYGDELFVLEGKLLLQKTVPPFIFAYNAVLEAEWEGHDYNEETGVLEQTLGVSYQHSPSVAFGMEAVHKVETPDWEWDEFGDHAAYVGPNVSFRTEAWWVTLTGLRQVTNLDDQFNYETRLIFGIHF